MMPARSPTHDKGPHPTAHSGTRTGTVCPACLIDTGRKHDESCCLAACLVTGLKRLDCPLLDEPGHDCGRDTWTGQIVGERECRELGWYSRPVPNPTGGGFLYEPCAPDDPHATVDLNRLYQQGLWNPERCRWEPLSEPDGPSTT
ncbi:hypothetical protein ALI22I_20360 [Saccharothrix sp. ALI-22-I]|nr:hypothetical protein ALI22I_20360 [Saccharothrix sp. ALI-22-I]